jgi:hypothetical protein
MLRYLLRVFVVYIIAIIVLAATAFADDQPANRSIQEPVWAIPVTLPTIAYVVFPGSIRARKDEFCPSRCATTRSASV